MTVSINGRYSHNFVQGVLVKETLNPANETVNRGHYAATTLSAVDVDLAIAHILSTINIFGFVGPATVQDIANANALVSQVLNPRTFYSVTGARKTGTMATVAIVADNDNYPTGYHAGNGGGLDAIDADLAPGNIKNGVTIFGKLGTLAPGVATHDIAGVTFSFGTIDQIFSMKYDSVVFASNEEIDLNSKTQNYAAGSLAEAFSFVYFACSQADRMKVKIYMDGVEVDESTPIGTEKFRAKLSMASRAIPGVNKIVKHAVKCYTPGATAYFLGRSPDLNDPAVAGIFCASVKVV